MASPIASANSLSANEPWVVNNLEDPGAYKSGSVTAYYQMWDDTEQLPALHKAVTKHGTPYPKGGDYASLRQQVVDEAPPPACKGTLSHDYLQTAPPNGENLICWRFEDGKA